MIVRITGTVADVEPDAVVIDREGLAREVLIPHYALGELTACRGRQVMLHTLEFFEGNQASGQIIPRLLGFPRSEDRDFFKKFIAVKGIGPRKALKALAQPIVKIASWIEQGDAKALSSLPGIGKRAAELILAELKGKMGDWAMGGGQETQADPEWTDVQGDAIELMVGLGDNRADVERWLGRAAQVHPDIETTDNWVRAAYRVRSGAEK